MQRYLIVLLAMLWTNQSTPAQSVIINEMSQGSDGGKEWVELLIVDEGVDLRGWELGDNDDGIWHPIAEFSNHSNLSNIARGTILVIFNSGDVDGTITAAGGEDTTFSDKSVLLGVNNASFLIDTGPWGGTYGAFANSDGDDAPALKDASDVIIHDMAVTHLAATVSAPGTGEVKYYTGNTLGGIVDDSQWTEASSSSATPGQANGGDNSNWVDQSLPVELSRWWAKAIDGEVRLNWTTDSEFENQGFIIERRHNSGDRSQNLWAEISSFVTNPDLLGQGSTSAQNEYSFIDKQVKVGESYSYRLSDVDYRGNIAGHLVISVAVVDDRRKHTYSLGYYPNPCNSEINLVVGAGNEGGPLCIDILNLRGEVVKNLYSGTPATSILNVRWNGTSSDNIPVSSGTYIVKISGPQTSQSKAITIIQ